MVIKEEEILNSLTIDKLTDLLELGEDFHLECKLAEKKLPNSIWETYSSMANTDGGLILLGIEEKKTKTGDSKFVIHGVNNPNQMIQDFWNTLNSNKVNRNLLIDSDVKTFTIDDKNIISIKIPVATYKEKPIFINGNPFKGTFKRTNEGDYHCSEEEIKAMIRDSSDSGNDDSLLIGYTFEDIDLATLQSYRRRFETMHPNHIWLDLDNISFLRNLGAIAKDRSTGKEWLTEAGLLMFGTGLAIRERFDNIRMDYIDQRNQNYDIRWNNRLTYDGSWENNLYNFFNIVLNKIFEDLENPFKLIDLQRIDDSDVHKSIREAVINMLIHSDYKTTGVLKIVKTNLGYSFSNPGTLKIPIETIYAGGNSKARNPRIQNMFRLIGFGENIGSGFPTIINAWTANNWRLPDLKSNNALQQVELNLWTQPIISNDISEELRNIYGDSIDKLSNLEKSILSILIVEKEVSLERLSMVLNEQQNKINQSLINLINQNFVINDKNRYWSIYKLNINKANNKSISEQSLNFKDEKEKQIYQYIKENGSISLSKVMKIAHYKSRQGASNKLLKMIEKNLIKRIKNGKEFSYVLNE